MINRVPLKSLYPEEKFLLGRTVRRIYDNFAFNDLPMADFSDTIFVLPSREAARLFREKTALKFKIHGGVTSLKIILPEELAVKPSEIHPTPPLILEKWIEVLKKAKEEKKIPYIIPDVEFSDNTFLSYAEYLSKVRENIILESGMDSEAFTETLEKNSPLRNKLEEYLIIEKDFYRILNSDHNKAQIILDTLNSPFEKFASVKKIILIECTEIRNAVAMLLQRLSEKITVEHLLNTTEDRLDDFDIYGRPLTEKMLSSYFDFDIEKTLRSYSNPIHEAMKIASFVSADKFPDCIGVLNNDLSCTLTHILENKNIQVNDPSPRPLNSFYWTKLFFRIADLRNRSVPFDAVYFFAADESVINYFNMADSALKIQKELEELQRDHLIQDLNSLIFFAEQKIDKYSACSNFCKTLSTLHKTVRSLDENDLIENIYGVFKNIAAANSLKNIDMNEAEKSLEGLKNAIIATRGIDDDTKRMLIFRHICNSTEISGAEKIKDNAVTLSGFLDLIWYENPSLIISGMTEESFASASQEDMLFPENIRRKMNWSSAFSRFGADIHRFDILLSQYTEDELFISYPIANTDGTLNSVARLFFNVDDEKMLKHCRLLFNQKLNEKIKSTPDDTHPTKLLYRPAMPNYKMPEKISVTEFQQYIQCPYTFYLNSVCKCKSMDDEKIELQPAQIGNILHSTMENYGKKYSLAVPDFDEMKKFMHAETEKFFTAHIGYAVNNITAMQNEELHNSIDAFAQVEYSYRSSFAAHKIHTAEHKINIPYGKLYDLMQQEWNNDLPPLEDELRDIRIVGKIDRIDLALDQSNNTICHLIDYKTYAKAKSPADVHFSSKAAAHLSEGKMYAICSERGHNKYFSDMQLVIYSLMAEFLREDLNIPNNAKIKCGYFNLPQDVSQTQIKFFNEMDYNLLRNGAVALHHLMQKIFIEKYFWPPSFSAEYGVLKTYFPTAVPEDLLIDEEVQNG